VAERFRRLPGLLVADVGVANRGADILVAEELLDFAQILSHVVKEDRGRGMPEPMGGHLPHPEGSATSPQSQIERPVGKWRPGVSRKHKLRSCEGDPARGEDSFALESLLNILPLEERCTQGAGNRHILEDASLAFNPEGHDFLSHPLAISPRELDQLLEPAGGLEKGVGQVEREGRAIALLVGFEV
jgi:hypothetical protein